MSKEKRMVTIIKGTGKPFIAKKVSRNAKCECGSGKKQKHCCGDETKYYTPKVNTRNYEKH